MIIDTHVHFYHPSLGDFEWPSRGSEFYRPFTPDMLRAEAGEKLSGCVLVGCSNEPALNLTLLGYTADHPLVCAYIAQFDPADPLCASHAERCRVFPKYRGFRVASSSALPYADRIDAMLTGDDVLELLGPWQDTARWAQFIKDRPETRFVVQHFGGYPFDGAPVPEEYAAFCREFSALPNVWMKLSGFFTLCQTSPKTQDPAFYRPVWETALSLFGPKRCMYGSDWPVSRMPYEACASLAEALCGADAQEVLFRTARRLYRIDTQQST